LQGIGAFFLDIKLEIAAFSVSVFVRLVEVRGIVVDLGDGDGAELSPEIIKGDEEITIVAFCVANLLLYAGFYILPIRIIVRPLSLELALSPRISQSDQLDELSLEVHFDSTEQGIGMTLDYS